MDTWIFFFLSTPGHGFFGPGEGVFRVDEEDMHKGPCGIAFGPSAETDVEFVLVAENLVAQIIVVGGQGRGKGITGIARA